MRQMGRAVSIMARAFATEMVMHDDVRAFHAPSECHALVARNEEKRTRQARRHAKAISGLSRREFNKAWKRVTPRIFDTAVGHIYNRMSPWNRD